MTKKCISTKQRMPMTDTAFVIHPPAQAAIPVAGGGAFPVRRIYTVGRNYRAHAAETGLGGAAGSKPGVSLKPADSLLPGGGDLAYPPGTAHLDPEVELVVAIGKGGADIAEASALDHVFGYAVGFDMIRRDVLAQCIADQHSWDLCKAFDGASPVGEIARAADIGHPGSGAIWIEVNGERRQHGDLADQIWTPAHIIARLSRLARIEPGDIVFTGTPAGPAAVKRGDVLHGHIDAVGELRVRIV
jgi:fumarylpyruvate hydrolase